MARLPTSAAQLLRPVLDMYMDSAVALVGCHSVGLNRTSCELDVLVVGEGARSAASVKLGGVFMDLTFIGEKEALRHENPEHAASMAHAKPIRDNSLVISTGSSAAEAVYSDSCRKSARGRLSSALKSLGRVDECLAAEAVREADFWLLSASYDFGYAWLYSKETVPAPSHLLRQLREASKGPPRAFEAFSRGAGLEKASRAACASRLEGVGVIHDVLRGRQESAGELGPGWQERYEMIRGKSQELAIRVEHAESYSFLGLSFVLGVREMAAGWGSKGPRHRSDLGSMFGGQEQFLGDRLLKELGLGRDRTAIEAALPGVKGQISSLAKKL
jgi:hypothetical protein